jgi:hypothetical protein
MVKSPPLKDLEKYLYRIDGKCYKYRPYAVKCNHDSRNFQQVGGLSFLTHLAIVASATLHSTETLRRDT